MASCVEHLHVSAGYRPHHGGAQLQVHDFEIMVSYIMMLCYVCVCEIQYRTPRPTNSQMSSVEQRPRKKKQRRRSEQKRTTSELAGLAAPMMCVCRHCEEGPQGTPGTMGELCQEPLGSMLGTSLPIFAVIT